MKTRLGFVSNSSSSSFVVLKDALTESQRDMIMNCDFWVDYFIKFEEQKSDDDETKNTTLKELFEYYDTDPWNIVEFDDFIFGSTTMDNFSMQDYIEYIKVNEKFIDWDDYGYDNEPDTRQMSFIRKMKNEYRKQKINKINKINKS